MVKRRVAGSPVAGAIAATVAAAVTLLAQPRGQAHPEFSAMGTNRYVTAAIGGGQIAITDTWLEGALAGAEERRRLDRDGNGRISDAELAQAQADVASEAPFVAVIVDEREAAAAATVTIDLGGDARATAAAVVVERRFDVTVDPGSRHRVQIVLRREPPRVMDTEVAIDLDPGLALLESFQGAGPGAIGGRTHFVGPRASALEDRSVTFRFAPRPPPAGPGRLLVVLLALAATAGAALAALHRETAPDGGGDAAHPGLAHVVFPALVATLLSFARGRMLPTPPAALALAATALAALLALLAIAPHLERATGHREAPLAARLVPSTAMLALTVAGAMLPLGCAPVGAAVFALALGTRAPAVRPALRPALAVVAATALALAVRLAALSAIYPI